MSRVKGATQCSHWFCLFTAKVVASLSSQTHPCCGTHDCEEDA